AGAVQTKIADEVPAAAARSAVTGGGADTGGGAGRPPLVCRTDTKRASAEARAEAMPIGSTARSRDEIDRARAIALAHVDRANPVLRRKTTAMMRASVAPTDASCSGAANCSTTSR